jgi:hypothetical protein
VRDSEEGSEASRSACYLLCELDAYATPEGDVNLGCSIPVGWCGDLATDDCIELRPAGPTFGMGLLDPATARKLARKLLLAADQAEGIPSDPTDAHASNSTNVMGS